jgi:hypothetical protein
MNKVWWNPRATSFPAFICASIACIGNHALPRKSRNAMQWRRNRQIDSGHNIVGIITKKACPSLTVLVSRYIVVYKDIYYTAMQIACHAIGKNSLVVICLINALPHKNCQEITVLYIYLGRYISFNTILPMFHIDSCIDTSCANSCH